MNIGKFIRNQRTKHKLTQSDLGDMLGVKNTTISNYENGISTPDLITFFKLSKIFSINYSPLISIFEDETDNCNIFKEVYSKFHNITKEIPGYKISTMLANPGWKCRTLTPESIVIIENNPFSFNDRDLVIASVPKGEEHIYRIRFCGGNTYLMPEDGPSYLCAVRIDKNTPLKRILAIIRYP